MKTILLIICFAFFNYTGMGKEMNFTGSTPAATVIRSFLGIPLTDSIDFIRWKLTFKNNNYTIQCNYGIGKPNTPGFINGGEKITLSNTWSMDKNIFLLKNGNKMLKIVRINDFLIHFLNTDNSLLVGNGGWSYTLNNMHVQLSKDATMKAHAATIKDSVAFEGRTPCGVPGIIPPGKLCYKLKWFVVLYANEQQNETGTYRLYGTPYRKEGGRRGIWKMTTDADGRTGYTLYNENEEAFIYLLKLDEKILVFTDAAGNLLVGDEDFSYTLNRISGKGY
ncbi:MAG: hypothetical protein QM802_21680 [Agriterribacter sp.]